jgi:hypothetical protein
VAAILPVRFGLFGGPLVLVSGSSGLLKQVKGWRHFTVAGGPSRGGASAPFPSDLRAAGPHEREKGNLPFGPKPEERGKDRAIDPTSGQKMRPLKIKSPNRFRALGQADGRQPFMPRDYLTIPAFEPYPFVLAQSGAEAAAFRRARRGAFHPAIIHYATVPFFCQ